MKKLILPILCIVPIFSYAQTDSIHWQYSHATDEMTNQITRESYIYSINSEQFAFPYNGGSRAWIAIKDLKPTRRAGRGRYQFYVGITRGQINASADDNANMFQAKFDNENPTLIFYTNASDNNNMVMIYPGGPSLGIIASGRSLLSTFANSHVLMIRIPVYGEGDKVFKFNIAELDLSKL